MNKLKVIGLAFSIFIGLSRAANAETLLLDSDSFVGLTFWIISMGTLAATAFFFLERSSVLLIWRTPITVAGLITGIAFIHYLYMRGVWVQTGDAPIVYRYIEWIITMPLQMITFYLILGTVRKVSSGIFWRLLIGTLVMVIGGYLGTAHINPMLGFVIWMTGWIYVLYEIFSGETGRSASKSGNKHFATAFSTLRMIVTIGWAIYPLGYIFGEPVTGGLDANSLNVIYNLADFVNKIAFGLVIWAAAVSGGRIK